MNPRSMPLAALAGECREQTNRFLRGESSLEEYCWEIIRRAIVDRDQAAWEAFFAQYRGIVLSWIRRHPASGRLADEPEFWLNRTFERLWANLTAERLDQFPSLAALLRYLQLCVNSILVDATRARAREQIEPHPEAETRAAGGHDPASAVIGALTRGDIWRVVRAEARSDEEALITQLCLVLGMKPREVCERYPAQFPDAQAVYRVKRNLLERLRRNPELRGFAHED